VQAVWNVINSALPPERRQSAQAEQRHDKENGTG
jgi:hypothetical protein